MNKETSRTLAELADLVGGTLTAGASVVVTAAAPLDEVAASELTFIDQPERSTQAAASPAAAVLVPLGVTCAGKPTIEVPDVHTAFSQIVMAFRCRRSETPGGISPAASISPTAQIAATATIGPAATIGDDVTIGAGSTIHAGAHLMAGCEIGENVTIFPAAVLYEDTVVGNRCVIHGGAVLGGYGFGYRQQNGQHQLSAQLGNVVIGDDVEVGSNCTIDRGTYSSTRIGNGTKIDNLVQIAHNCQIGNHNLLCAQVGIAGSTSTGDYVVMAGQVGVRDHVHIGEGARIGAMAGVSNDIAPGVVAFGAPAIPERDQKVLLASLAKLPEMRREFKQVRKTLREMQAESLSPRGTTGDAAIDPAA